jgi:hypothetical protein
MLVLFWRFMTLANVSSELPTKQTSSLKTVIEARNSLTGILNIPCFYPKLPRPTIPSIFTCTLQIFGDNLIQWRTEGRGLGGVQLPPPPPKFRSFAKAEPNSQFRGIYICNKLIRIWVSFICKLSGTPN